MPFNPFNEGGSTPINPYTGSETVQRVPVSSDGVRSTIGARRTPVQRRTKAPRQGVPGTKRRVRQSRGVGPVGATMPKIPTASQMPQSPMSPESPPIGTDWSMARGLGNGGYRNGGY
jgi:hypothetical protein